MVGAVGEGNQRQRGRYNTDSYYRFVIILDDAMRCLSGMEIAGPEQTNTSKRHIIEARKPAHARDGS